MNLKQGGGRVPIRDDDGYRLVAMPDREAFDAMLPRRTQEILDRMWSIINMRLSGQTLAAVAKEHGVSIERVRQIEAHFQRKLASHLSTLS
jgi:DNA-directed RNA polymerase sigma subunit (sigma70/sigma32)